MHSTSVTLLQRVRQSDDQRAWARFVELYLPLLLTWARQMGIQDADGSEIAQEVMVQLLKEIKSFEYDANRGRFRGWLKTVAMNKLRERHRRRNVHHGIGGDTDHFANLAGSAPALAFWEVEDQDLLVRRAMQIMQSEFESKTWKAFWEHLVSGRTAAEIGQELGLSEASVYVAKSRVLKRLREEFAGFLD